VLEESVMTEQDREGWGALGAAPGLCASCQHAKLNATNRGTAYLRCTRAAWDPSLSRYPNLPVLECQGFERAGAPLTPAG
jgi:hypothetical protein